jgi:hypothetical protein
MSIIPLIELVVHGFYVYKIWQRESYHILPSRGAFADDLIFFESPISYLVSGGNKLLTAPIAILYLVQIGTSPAPSRFLLLVYLLWISCRLRDRVQNVS